MSQQQSTYWFFPLSRESKEHNWAKMRKWRWLVIHYLFVIVFTCVISKILDMISLACTSHHRRLYSDWETDEIQTIILQKSSKVIQVWRVTDRQTRDSDHDLQSYVWIILNVSGSRSWQMILLANVKVGKLESWESAVDKKISSSPKELPSIQAGSKPRRLVDLLTFMTYVSHLVGSYFGTC